MLASLSRLKPLRARQAACRAQHSRVSRLALQLPINGLAYGGSAWRQHHSQFTLFVAIGVCTGMLVSLLVLP